MLAGKIAGETTLLTNLNRLAATALLAAGLILQHGFAPAQTNQVIIGYSGTGLTTDLRKIIVREHISEKHNLSVKSVYFNSGSLMSQAMLGSSITASNSDVPAVMGLAKSLREFPVPEEKGVQGALDSLTHPNAKTTKPASIMAASLMEEIRKSSFIAKLYGRPSRNEK